MSSLVKAKARLDKLSYAWRDAHQNLRDDRNIIAGQIYEQQKVINMLIDEQAREEYAAEWLKRWPRVR